MLSLFGARKAKAQENYREYAKQGAKEVEGLELSWGGPIRSAGALSEFRRPGKNKKPLQGDERTLGDSEFVARVRLSAEERSARNRKTRSTHHRLDQLGKKVASLMNVRPKDIYQHRKHPESVRARSVFCYWAVKEFGESVTALAGKLGISQPGVSISVKRGAKIVKDLSLRFSGK